MASFDKSRQPWEEAHRNPGTPILAAEYLRMSTEQQQYSLRNQKETIQCYAQKYGFEVVRTYVDSGRSGITIKNRPELTRLLRDVLAGEASIQAILVYDVSRWGRFQDCDEAAHYEYLCRAAGVPVHFCAETFPNDVSLASSIMKALRRAMAAEYSREMGVKCFAGAKKLAELGFKQGGTAGYGLRRLLLSADGAPKRIMSKGERKGLRTDRVVLALGPREQVECVQEIFRLVVEENRSAYYIAQEMNRRGIAGPNGRWRCSAITRILTDPKYCGHNVWNRSSSRLGRRVTRVPKQNWVMVSGAFAPVVDKDLFQKAQTILNEQKERYTQQNILEDLRRVLQERGKLSFPILQQTPNLPSMNTIVQHFGSLRSAFERAGYQPPWPMPTEEQRIRARQVRRELIERVVCLFPQEVASHSDALGETGFLVIGGELRISVVVCPEVRRNRRREWFVDRAWAKPAAIALLTRLTPDSTHPHDSYVLQTPSRKWIRPAELKNHHKLSVLSDFCRAARTLALST